MCIFLEEKKNDDFKICFLKIQLKKSQLNIWFGLICIYLGNFWEVRSVMSTTFSQYFHDKS